MQSITKSSFASMSESARRKQIRSSVAQCLSNLDNGKSLAEVVIRVKRYEAEYGLESSELENELRSGHIKETDKIVRWMMSYRLLQRAGKMV